MSIHFKMCEGDPQDEHVVLLSEIADKMKTLLEEDIEPEVRGEGRNFFDIVSDQLARYRGRIAQLESQIIEDNI